MLRRLLCALGCHGRLWHIFTINANTQISSEEGTIIVGKPIKIKICPHCGRIVGKRNSIKTKFGYKEK